MAQNKYPLPLVGFAEAVRQHGDNWRARGMFQAERLQDEGRRLAFIHAGDPNSDDWKEAWGMLYIVKHQGPNGPGMYRSKPQPE